MNTLSEEVGNVNAIEVVQDYLARLKGEYRQNEAANILIECNDFFRKLGVEDQVVVLNYLMGIANERIKINRIFQD